MIAASVEILTEGEDPAVCWMICPNLRPGGTDQMQGTGIIRIIINQGQEIIQPHLPLYGRIYRCLSDEAPAKTEGTEKEYEKSKWRKRK